MLLVLAGWCFWGTVFVGIGRLVAPRTARQSRWQDDATAGLAVLLLALQVWQLAAPVATMARCIAIVLAIAGFARARNLRLTTATPSRLLLAIQAVVAIGLARIALGDGANGDSGMYHRQVVRWFEAYPLVPGLNVLGVAPFNSAHFLYVALLEARPWAHTVHHIASSLLVALVTTECLEGIWSIARNGARSTFEALLAGLLAPVIVDMITGRDFASDSPDLAATFFEVLLALRMARCIEATDPVSRRAAAWHVSLIAGAALTVKPSTAGVVCAAFAIVALSTWRLDRTGARFGLVAGLLAGATWCGRNVIMTGYPFYPATLFALPVDWRISAEMAGRVHRYIVASARWWGGPVEPVLEGFAWANSWFRRLATLNRDFVIPVTLAIALFGVARLRRRIPLRPVCVLYVVVAMDAVFWFFTAPDVRFAGALFWLAFAIAGSDALLAHSVSGWSARTSALVVVLVASYPLLRIHPTNWAWLALRPEPKPLVHDFTTDSGFRIRVADDHVCWDTDPPCLPFPLPGLHEREPGRVRRGFAGDAWSSFDPGTFAPLWWDAR